MPSSTVRAVAVTLVALGAIIVVLSTQVSFHPQSGGWLVVASGLANVALGFLLIAGQRKEI